MTATRLTTTLVVLAASTLLLVWQPWNSTGGAKKPSPAFRGSGIAARCSDGRDNDRDGNTDFPADPGCSSANDNTEKQ
jgi:hypothetical protein